MSIVVLGLNHRTAPVTLRERFAFAEARVPAALEQIRSAGIAEEVVILSTCNRVEIYASTRLEPRAAFDDLQEFLTRLHDYRDPLSDELYRFAEPQSIEHLFRVASGMDSMVLGETEIFGQLKKAYELAMQHQHTGPALNRAFQKAFNVAKQIRTETGIQRGSISVASVAVELAEKIFDKLSERTVLVIGAGDTSEKTARALLSRGARSVLVSNRTFERAEELAATLGGRAVRFDDWDREFAGIDIVISSTSAPGYVIDRARLAPLMDLRRNRPLLLIDIAVPRDIEPEVNFWENVYLYNVDDLQTLADDYLRQRKEELAKCDAIIREKAKSLLETRRPTGLRRNAQPAFGHD
jgi:glutamyl-tRNA reductase